MIPVSSVPVQYPIPMLLSAKTAKATTHVRHESNSTTPNLTF